MATPENIRYCPVCEQSFSTPFAPSHYGITHRPDASCLNADCQSLERHRLLWLYLKDKLLVSQISVLEIGPTKSLQRAFEKIPNIQYVGLDLTSRRANVRADINSLPFAKNTFDVAICYQVLEHIPDFQKAVRELNRVIRPSGTVFFQVPLDINLENTFEIATKDPSEREKLYGQSDHLRVFGMDFPDYLDKGGFNTVCVDYVSDFSSQDQTRLGLKSTYLIGPKAHPYTTTEKFYKATKKL